MFSWMLLNVAHAETITNPLKVGTIGELIKEIANYFYVLSASVATLAILYGAFLLMSSGGMPEKVTQGRNIILYALLGVFLIFISLGLVNLVVDILGGTS
jgi:flagellar biosynthesis protein FlhB